MLCLVLVTTISSVAAQDTPQTESVVAQAFRTVNVRQGPGTRYVTVAHLAEGDSVAVIGRNNLDNDWLLVDTGDVQGWIAFFTVTVTGNPDTLPIVEPPAAEANTSASGSVSAVDTSGLPEGVPYLTAFRRVTVRSGPSTRTDRLGILEPNTVTEILGRVEGNHWLLIDFDGEPGWVAYFVVNVTGDIDTLPIVDAEGNVVSDGAGS
ncbi:MAG: SH3 domain-containing protein [Anaerolineae bacterium]